MLLLMQFTATEKKPSSPANASHSAQPELGAASAERPRQAGDSAAELATGPADAWTVSIKRRQAAASIAPREEVLKSAMGVLK
jgi:hypothetical protein